ncbi:Crp/Fnr family transcriptional regulator [Clostridium botulinum]|uniref:Crp/Fnr family transcriptional regulator n=1 Tax=unclassified Clostridium TaxID=2614128 RepID=UPI000501C6CB|nr:MULTISPECIES: Crp/Fnr family transcriptional regulator [unclassified Clostridium]KFX56586.1 Crp/Fnr family transcriptional regulator [Clostridium botulinum]MBY6777934.1 Crp/Fnr family transcriptional regulator [Clostridium botulinum]MBY6851078.1 Crp/Fnr family transcriptional regulator [Clostridium botulinum]MBY7008914.1 Crp/Fnr family transcriptional regulator [Clostridium botulinum]NFF25097.1 Crp/Fnr family transcriptional regulator [Clostridium botulinum]
MDKSNFASNVRENNLKEFYEIYEVLEYIDKENNKIISKKAKFKTLNADEYISSGNCTCEGIIFVINGTIKIQRINENGEETNLFNIKKGELCHEALSCLLNFKSLNIIGKALQQSKICIIPFEIVTEHLFKDSEFLKYMYKDIYSKFNTVIEKKEEKRHDSLETRIAKLLISKKSKIVYSTHKELAFEIDSTREVVSRKLKKFEQMGYVNLERGKIIILKDLNEFLK